MKLSRIDPHLADLCEAQFDQMGWRKPPGYFLACLTSQQAGEMVVFVAHEPGQYLGHAKLVWQTDYPPFRAAGIPEIQDLNVLPAHRRQGIGTALITRCESTARERSATIGIGVGLHPGYNNAQKLYAALGYKLDGRGVYYDGTPVIEGRSYPFDDSLIMHLTKTLDDKG